MTLAASYDDTALFYGNLAVDHFRYPSLRIDGPMKPQKIRSILLVLEFADLVFQKEHDPSLDRGPKSLGNQSEVRFYADLNENSARDTRSNH